MAHALQQKQKVENEDESFVSSFWTFYVVLLDEGKKKLNFNPSGVILIWLDWGNQIMVVWANYENW